MFNIIVSILQTAMLITVFVTLPLLFVIRIITVINNKSNLKDSLLIVLLPFSFGYYFILNKDKQTKLYNILIIVLTVVAIIGILFTFYQRLIPDY